MKLNFPFTLPKNINEERSEEGGQEVKKVLEEAHHAFIDRHKYLDDFIRTQMEKLGCTYMLDHQIMVIGNTTEKWLKIIAEWQEREKKARTASAAELVKLRKSKNPLVQLLLAELTTEPEPTTKAQGAEASEEDDEEEEELVVKGIGRGSRR